MLFCLAAWIQAHDLGSKHRYAIPVLKWELAVHRSDSSSTGSKTKFLGQDHQGSLSIHGCQNQWCKKQLLAPGGGRSVVLSRLLQWHCGGHCSNCTALSLVLLPSQWFCRLINVLLINSFSAKVSQSWFLLLPTQNLF